MKAAFFTLGCKVNQYETAAMQRQFSEAGYEIVNEEEKADVYVINSCTVTADGDKKSLKLLRRIRRGNPEAVVCLCGCFPQAFPDIAREAQEADIIMGSKNRSKLLRAVNERLAGSAGRFIDIEAHADGEKIEDLKIDKIHLRTRAFIKIEDGCNRNCAYCIIPAARGSVRSKPLPKLLEEIDGLAAAGYKEVVLTGINLSSYGQDMGLRMIDAVKLSCGVKGIERVRLSSLEPELLTPRDITEMAKLPKLCPEFHLSLQSGCDSTLKRMRRFYTTLEYRRTAELLRKAFDNSALTTDIMIGFPGETDGEFSESVKFCADMGFAKAHVFTYSKRPGTKAADMPDQIPDRVKRERSRAMIETTNKTRGEFLLSQTGKTANVLFETRRDDGRWEGYSENYTSVIMKSDEDLSGKILSVTLTGVEGEACVAERRQIEG